MREFQLDKFLQNVEHLLALGSQPRGIWALIKCVHNNVERGLPLKFNNSFQTIQKRAYARFSGAIAVGRIHGRESLRELIGL